MENVIEVRYAGVTVGRSTKVRDWSASGAFIGFAEPLPSGTALVLKGDGVEQAARVVGVVESADPGVAGMQVRFVAAEAAKPAKPAAAAPKPEPVAAPAASPAEAVPNVPAVVAESPPVVPAAVEAAPLEVSGGTSSAAVASEISGPASAEHGPNEIAEAAETGATPPQGQGGGKRRRRRR